MEEYEEINMDGYEEAKALMDKIGAKSEEILKRENKFLATQARAREALAAKQRIQKRNFAQSQEPLIRIKEDLEAQLNNNPFYKQLDDKSVYIRLGDFKQEIIDYLGISNIDVFLFTDLDWIEGSYTPEELKNLLKSSDKTSKRFFTLYIESRELKINYEICFEVDLNSELADGRSVIDALNVKNFVYENNSINSLSFDSDYCEDCIVKIPLKGLLFDSSKCGNIYFGNPDEDVEDEYLYNSPFDVFSTCVMNCTKKKQYVPKLKKDE